jgi:hypothetical protein
MSSIQIPNLPAVIGLDGAELFEGVQAGTSVKISLAQMIAATRAGLPTTLPIPVSLGGTGATTLTGYVKGNGTSPFTASPTIPNTDITGLGTMSTQNANAVAITGGTAAFTGASSVTVNSSSAALTVTQTGSGNAFLVEDSASDTTPFVIDASGNVGVGTGSPPYKLTVQSTSTVAGFQRNIVQRAGTQTDYHRTSLVYNDSATATGAFAAFSSGLYHEAGGGFGPYGLVIATGASAGPITLATSDTERMRIDASGNVGIGTVTPADKLQVEGNIYLGTSNRTIYSGGSANLNIQVNTGQQIFTRANGATESMRINASGNLGVGISNPLDRLSVSTASGSNPSNNASENAVRLTSTATAGVGVGPSMLFEGQTGNTTAQYGFAAIQGFKGSATVADYSGALAFFVQPSGGAALLTERLRVASAGQIGIGGANYGTSGQTIVSAGSGAAPAWGTLPVAGGGTGQASNLTQYGIVYGSTTTAMATTAAGTTTTVLHGNAAGAPTFGAVSLTADVSGTLPVANGGTGVTTAPAEAARILGYTSTATAAGTTVLTNTSTQYQLFTGATTQTITLPVTSTLGTGWSFHIVNNSTGSLTVNSSGGNLVATIIAGLSAMVTCIGTTLTTAADWEAGFTDFQSVTGTGAVVLGTGPTITGAVSANATSGNGAIVGQQIFNLAANLTAFGPAIGDFFGATSAISLEASSVYEIVIYAVFTKTTAGTATWTLTASSAPTRMVGVYQGSPITGIAAGTPINGFTGSQGATTAAFSATGSLTTAVNHAYQFNVQVQTNAASSFKLQLTQSAGTATPLAGSYYTVKKISATTGTFV